MRCSTTPIWGTMSCCCCCRDLISRRLPAMWLAPADRAESSPLPTMFLTGTASICPDGCGTYLGKDAQTLKCLTLLPGQFEGDGRGNQQRGRIRVIGRSSFQGFPTPSRPIGGTQIATARLKAQAILVGSRAEQPGKQDGVRSSAVMKPGNARQRSLRRQQMQPWRGPRRPSGVV